MKIDFLVSTMNRIDDKFLKRMFASLSGEEYGVIVVNQCDANTIKKAESIVPQFINVLDRGLAKSRNLALKNSTADYIVICDDDVVYKTDTINLIAKSINDNLCFDVLTFKIGTPTGDKYKNYPREAFVHNRFSIFRVSSIEIVVNLKSISNNEINFDDRFGLGSTYISAEENIFLSDCLKSGLKAKFIPETIVLHDLESSSSNFSELSIITKGAAFYRMFGSYSFFICILFSIKQYSRYRNYYNLIYYNKLLLKGIKKVRVK